jgi:LemA protein
MSHGQVTAAAILAFILIVSGMAYRFYAGLIRKKNQVLEALSGIDVQLTKRFDLLPEILALAKRYMLHEKGLIAEVTAMRGTFASLLRGLPEGELKDGIARAEALNGAMGRLFAVMENYPELKSEKIVSEAMDVYRDTEENLAAARRFYNSAVKELNNGAEIFPGSLIASSIGIREYPFFASEDGAGAKIRAAGHL